jgi:hypothetical protein
MKGLVVRIVILRQVIVTTFPPTAIIKCIPARTARIPKYPSPRVSPGTTTLPSLEAESGRYKNLTAKIPSDFEPAPDYLFRKIPLLPFNPTSFLYHWMTVCNSSLGYSKVLYHVARLILHYQHVKEERHGQPVARVPSIKWSKIQVLAGRTKEAQGSVCRGPQKRQTSF